MKGAETNGLCVLFVTMGPRTYAKFTAVGTVYFKFKFVVRLVYVHAVVHVYVRRQLGVGRAGRTRSYCTPRTDGGPNRYCIYLCLDAWLIF